MFEILAVHLSRQEVLGPYGQAEDIFLAIQQAVGALARAGAKVFLFRNVFSGGEYCILVFSPSILLAFRIRGGVLLSEEDNVLDPSAYLGPHLFSSPPLEA